MLPVIMGINTVLLLQRPESYKDLIWDHFCFSVMGSEHLMFANDLKIYAGLNQVAKHIECGDRVVQLELA